jgi:hypothetical protein
MLWLPMDWLGLQRMTRFLFVTFLFAAILAIYGINRGVFVGSKRYVASAECCPDLDTIQKRCRYLFVTGVSEIDARDGVVSAPRANTDQAAFLEAIKKPDNIARCSANSLPCRVGVIEHVEEVLAVPSRSRSGCRSTTRVADRSLSVAKGWTANVWADKLTGTGGTK